jgi:hypothetical protein
VHRANFPRLPKDPHEQVWNKLGGADTDPEVVQKHAFEPVFQFFRSGGLLEPL